jgi:hypothetical protein
MYPIEPALPATIGHLPAKPAESPTLHLAREMEGWTSLRDVSMWSATASTRLSHQGRERDSAETRM